MEKNQKVATVFVRGKLDTKSMSRIQFCNESSHNHTIEKDSQNEWHLRSFVTFL